MTGMASIMNMQILLTSKMHLDFSIENKHLVIALSIRRFLFLMKHLFPNKKKLFDGQKPPWMIAEI